MKVLKTRASCLHWAADRSGDGVDCHRRGPYSDKLLTTVLLGVLSNGVWRTSLSVGASGDVGQKLTTVLCLAHASLVSTFNEDTPLAASCAVHDTCTCSPYPKANAGQEIFGEAVRDWTDDVNGERGRAGIDNNSHCALHCSPVIPTHTLRSIV